MIDEDNVTRMRSLIAKASHPPQPQQDTLGQIITAVTPWARRYFKVWSSIAAIFLIAKLWQIHNLAGGFLQMNAWINANDRLFVLRCLAGPALLAFLIVGPWYLFVKVVQPGFKRRS